MYETKLKNKNEEKIENKSAKFTKNSILKISKIFKNTKNNKASKNNNHIKKNYIKIKIGKLAVDPGGNKITGITDVKTPNGELQVLKYTTDQYYHDSKINEKNYLMKNYYSQWLNKPQNEHVKQLSYKVSSTEDLMKYFKCGCDEQPHLVERGRLRRECLVLLVIVNWHIIYKDAEQ